MTAKRPYVYNEDLYMLGEILYDPDLDKDTLAWYVSAGLDVNAKGSDGYTALHIAAMADWDEQEDGRMRVLLAAGAHVDALAYTQAGGPWTPLMLAAWEGLPGQVKELLRWGADPNVADDRGRTALMLAVIGSPAYEMDEKVRALLEAGAETEKTNDMGLTALDLARRRQNVSLNPQVELTIGMLAQKERNRRL